VARDRADLATRQGLAEGQRRENQQGATAEGGGEPIPLRTGDWSHQASAKDRPRDGTHPYFKELQDAPLGRNDAVKLTVPSNIRWTVTKVGLAMAALVVVVTAFWTLRDQERAPAESEATGPRESGPAAAQKAVLPPPGGAGPGPSVYSADDGIELGRTPLLVAVPTDASRTLELRHPGYQMASVNVEAGDARRHVVLTSAAGEEAKPQATSPPQIEERSDTTSRRRQPRWSEPARHTPRPPSQRRDQPSADELRDPFK
jgi:hypothetical protein